ncbi:MAG: rhodanese-related sulfurtransferase [Bacteroidetes bacterium]|nr:rhodanese-related sulfurtransferase [Bacteroidota bacterium]
MSLLHNRVNNEELKRRMLAESEPRTTISFYKYFCIAEPQAFRDRLWQQLNELHVFGRIYVASEGINGQISVPGSQLDAFRSVLYSYPEMYGIRLNIAVDDNGKSFWVLRIKVRPKIVADGIDDPGFNPANGGHHLKAAEFNKLAEEAGTIIVDMRNHYEFEVGHFDQALEVPSDTFREQLPMAASMLQDKKDAPIIMYCTGGIRCEKASAYMRHHGFTNVFQLEGGIIEYTRQAKEQGLPIKFVGKNFVFDERMGERISEDVIAHCHQCGAPADTHVNCANDACHMLFIQCAECAEKMKGCCSDACVEEWQLPGAERSRIAAQRKAEGVKAFNKSKGRLRAFRTKDTSR